MASNSFGEIFRFTTWGESHGAAIGCVIDGCPPMLPLAAEDFRHQLDRRRTGQSKFTSQRREEDAVKILSGVFDGMTTGTPICLLIENTDARSKDYSDIRDVFRPGHADYTYAAKYGIRDYRGGGRSSARETTCRVMAGVVARKILGESVRIYGGVIQIGKHRANPDSRDWTACDNNPFFSPDTAIVPTWEDYLNNIRESGTSVGAVVEIVADGVVAGLGDPIYLKLDSEIAKALMSINAVKGVEIGDGFACVPLHGEENGDAMRRGTDGAAVFMSNHAGGILGGISTGQPIVARFAVKPTSSIITPQKTVDYHANERDVITKGRHDPCVGIRAVPVGEAMLACVLADALLRQRTLGRTI